MIVGEFLDGLRNENGFKFGTPWRYSDKALGVIVPILKTGYVGEREYITLEEAKDKGVDFKDSGHINKVLIESSLSTPIFIRSGTILKSQGTQTRAVESSVIIVPSKEGTKEKKTQEILVRCIYASKVIRTGEKFAYGGDTPIEVRSALLSRSGQLDTWKAVGGATHRFMSNRLSSSGTGMHSMSYTASHDNLAGVMEDVDKFKEKIY